jgi:hypothetical protein
VVDAAAGPPPWFLVVSETEIVAPAVAVAGAVNGDTTRSARRSKFAEQLTAALIVTLPSEQSASPLQPVNTEPEPAAAERDTTAPVAKVEEHVVPQEIPEGALVTVPVPVPVFVTVSVGDVPPQELPPSP